MGAKNPSYVNLSKFNIGGISSYIKIYRRMNDCSIKMVSFCTLNLEKWLKIRLFWTSFLIPTRKTNLNLKQICFGGLALFVAFVLDYLNRTGYPDFCYHLSITVCYHLINVATATKIL